MSAFTLDDLAALVAARSASTAEASYTKALLEAGLPRAARKFGEEAVELVVAALGDDRAAVVAESADLLYHLLVVLRLRDISLSEVLDELQTRTVRSGHAEKAARPR